jgi:hypothetical protein
MLRAAGGVDQKRLLAFLDQHAATMPRTLLRYSIEHLDKQQREHYMGRKQLEKKPADELIGKRQTSEKRRAKR